MAEWRQELGLPWVWNRGHVNIIVNFVLGFISGVGVGALVFFIAQIWGARD